MPLTALLAWLALAQAPAHSQTPTSPGMAPASNASTVYRCGQEYTNTPAQASRCERLPLLPQVTVIEGTRVQNAPAPPAGQAPTPGAAQATPPGSPVPMQAPREDMARAIIATELDKARQRHAQLLQQQAAGNRSGKTSSEGAKANADGTPSPASTSPPELLAALERSQRDIDSLQREFERRFGPVPTVLGPTPPPTATQSKP